MSVTTEIRPGVVLADRFRVHGRLGAGGMATVFLAEDCILCRDVAIKRLHAEGSEADIRRFRREARLGASLTHPNLVTRIARNIALLRLVISEAGNHSFQPLTTRREGFPDGSADQTQVEWKFRKSVKPAQLTGKARHGCEVALQP
jgi:serine/threonine protein kinase